MSWFWGSQKTKDATADLDPSLRDFLDKETARQQTNVKAAAASQQEQADRSAPFRTQTGLSTPGIRPEEQNTSTSQTARSDVPPESLYQDGRYAHLWKTYQSQEALAASTATDQDKMGAILESMEDRKAAIGRAALENCVVEQLEQQECYRSGSMSKLMFMCRDETRSFNRCYEMQARFLRALGYLSVPRSDQEEEKIQMHADKLYQNMLRREKDAADAKAAGKELPPTVSLIQADEALNALGKDSNYARMRADAIAEPSERNGLNMFSKEAREAILSKVKDMHEEERQLELQLVVAEARVTRDVSKQLGELATAEADARQWRKDNNQQTLAEKIRGLLGYKS